MKTLFLSSITLLLSLFISNPAMGQTYEKADTNNYVVLTKKIPQLQPIILTAIDLAKEDGNDFGDFQVIVCGQTVKDLTNNELMEDFIEKAKAAGVKIVACGFSLKKFGVDSSKLPPEIEVVKNGILYNFQLQKKGYRSIEL